MLDQLLPKDLSIILVNWKSADYLEVCLASVYRSVRSLSFEVIVVDNASQDGCGEMLRTSFPQVQLISLQENLGFARANNVGVRRARGGVLLFLNPDTELRGDALQRMYHWLKRHPEVGAAGPRLLNADGTDQQSCVQAFPTLANQFLDADLFRRFFPSWRIWGTGPLANSHRGAAKVDAVSGACLMVQRDAFESVGGFTEEYFMYSDDLDLCYKLSRRGYSVVCLPDCTVVHYGGGSSARRDPLFAAIQRRQAMLQFLRRTRGPLCGASYRALMAVAAILRIAAALSSMPWSRPGAKRESRKGVLLRWRGVLRWSCGLAVSCEDAPLSRS